MAYKIQYESETLGPRLMVSEYSDAKDAERAALEALEMIKDIFRVAVVKKDGSVYAEHKKEVR